MENQEIKDKKLEKILERIDAGRTYRNMDIMTARAAQEGESERYAVEGYATVFDTPYLLYDSGNYRVYEQVDARAFDGCDMSDVIMQYDHEGRVFARTSNNTLDVAPDKKGLHITGKLGGTDIGRGIYEDIRNGYINKMSFGFRIGETKREITEDVEHNATTVLRTITKISKLYDVSAVSLPANDATEISARGFCDGLIAELKAERLERAKAEKLEAECLALLSL